MYPSNMDGRCWISNANANDGSYVGDSEDGGDGDGDHHYHGCHLRAGESARC